MSQLDKSFEDKEATDMNAITDEYADPSDIKIPVKKLSDEFDTVATKPSLSSTSNEDGGMKVYLRVRPIADKTDSTVFIESPTSILTSAPESSKRAQYTKTEERKYVSISYLYISYLFLILSLIVCACVLMSFPL